MTPTAIKNIENDFEILVEIVRQCREIECISIKFYRALEKMADTEEDAVFWRHALNDEQGHLVFWNDVLSLAKCGLLPQIFDDPAEIRDEILSITGKALELLSELPSCAKDFKATMTMAFRIEFYCLHRALAPIFSLMGDLSPCASYETHLQSFVDMYKLRCGSSSPELLLLGETIQRLWTDNLRLSRQCFFDELSGLLNRRGFQNSVKPLLSLAKRRRNFVAMMLLDIDDFKKANDLNGHAAGDEILSEVAKVLRGAIRDSDITARYGGDEFLVFCPEIAPFSSKTIADKILHSIRSSSFRGVFVTVSIGVVECMPSEEKSSYDEISSLIKAADKLLYVAKHNGRNRFAWEALSESSLSGRTCSALPGQMIPHSCIATPSR